jgi:hypothetical protein
VTAPVKQPTAELVGQELIKTFANIPSDIVGMSLPADSSKWQAYGFVQVSVLAGTTPPGLSLRKSVLTLDFWAIKSLRTLKPDFGKAANLAENVHKGARDHRAVQVTVSPGPGYPAARVLTAYPMNDPVQRPSASPGGASDAAAWAHYGFEMAMNWVSLG